MEIPIEPIPAGPLVMRSGAEAGPELPVRPPQVAAVAPEKEGLHAGLAPREREDRAEGGAVRPPASQPTPSAEARRPARFTDRRHPFRAAVGLVLLVVFAAIVLAASFAAAIGAIAFAIRQTAS